MQTLLALVVEAIVHIISVHPLLFRSIQLIECSNDFSSEFNKNALFIHGNWVLQRNMSK